MATYISYISVIELVSTEKIKEIDVGSLDWSLITEEDDTIAHYASKYKQLPLGFIDAQPDLFIQPNKYGWTPAHWYVHTNMLPEDFPHWGLSDKNGNTIAIEAAKHNTLPPGFHLKYPDIFIQKNVTGNTPAYFYVKKNILPVDFPHWGLENNEGMSIIHAAVSNNTFPTDYIKPLEDLFIKFDVFNSSPATLYVMNKELSIDYEHWGVTDEYGNTLVHTAVDAGTLPKEFIDKHMDLFIKPNKQGVTPAHKYVLDRALPLDFKYWGLKDRDGNTVAHWATDDADNLPCGFEKKWPKIWKTKNKDGYTVEDFFNISMDCMHLNW